MIDTRTDIKDIALRSMEIMRDGTYEDFVEVVHPEAVNHESKDEPPATRGRGPAAFYATALWLRDAFADLDFEVHTVVAEEDLVVVHNTMTGVHARAFVGYKPDGTVDQAFPADRPLVRLDPDALAARARRPGRRALGEPRRHGHGAPARLDPALSRLPRAHGARDAPGAQAERRVAIRELR